ncbi:MAG: lipopolysaccharide transport periplasmic protein LptA [Rhizobiaceae bacterium]|nr:lipopolysaccharide transport periplasmic protein LptA [Rhizobiaceae bacterium]
MKFMVIIKERNIKLEQVQMSLLFSGFHKAFHSLVLMAMLVFGLSGLVTPALAQNFGGAFEGMQDNDQPIQIEADRLEIEDSKGTAFFKGNVNVVQGTTILKAGTLRVYYFGKNDGKGNGSGTQIKKIVAGGKIAVRSGDQLATADSAVFNMQTDTVELKGNVTVSQGDNIATGCLLRVNIKTNAAKLEPCKGKGGRVRILLTPGSQTN